MAEQQDSAPSTSPGVGCLRGAGSRAAGLPAGAPRARGGRRARRIAVGTAVVAATAALVTGCGDADQNSAGPQKVSGTAAPAGSSPNGAEPKGSSSPTSSGEEDAGKDKGQAAEKGGGTDASGTGGQQEKEKPEPTSGGSDGNGSGGGACGTDALTVRIGDNHPGMGQRNFAVVLTNSSGQTCTVRGYPGFAFINNAGEEVSIDPVRTGGASSPVELSPGASAWAPLSYSNPEMTGVTTVTPDAVAVTPPDQHASLRAAWSGGPVTNTGKASVPKIGPLSPGSGA